MVLNLRRSGLLKAVDLLVIDTERFTLAIEGDIDFSKYERCVNGQDYMILYFQGLDSAASIQLFDANVGELVEYKVSKKYLPIFFENGQYTLVIQPKTEDRVSFYHEYKPFREAITYRARMNVLSGTLHFQNEVGLSSFEIRSVDEQMLAEITLEVFPTKLDYKKDYQALLQEVNEEIYNLAYHFIQRTYMRGSAKIFKDPSLTEFYRLLEGHFDKYRQAIIHVEQMPHHQLVKHYVEVDGSQLRRQDHVSRSYLRKNASRFVDVEQGIELLGRTVMPKKGLLMKKFHTVDTHENRYVKWTMERLIGRLQHLQKVLLKSQARYSTANYQDIAEFVEKMEQTIRKFLCKPFWREVGKLDRLVSSLVLQMAPGYREVYQIYVKLSQSIVLKGELYKMSMKNIATLYEYWTFLKLGQIVGQTCEPLSQDIVQVRTDGLFVNLDASSSAVQTYKHPVTGEEIVLTYQYRTNNKLPTVQQIPDTMLSIGKKGKNYHYKYIFDAKYRIDFESAAIPGPKQDDVNTMHRYRDSIVAELDNAYERIAFGAYVLFPWGNVEEYIAHPLYKSIKKVNIGGLPFLPNATKLVEEIIYNLINRSADELQRQGILPRGFSQYTHYTKDERILIFKISVRPCLQEVINQKRIAIKQKLLPIGWEQACHIALYFDEAVREYGQVFSSECIGDEVVFRVDAWSSLYKYVRSEGYDIVEPVLIMKNALLDARCLPEMFLSTMEARQIWNVLRQLSDEVVVVLNSSSITNRSFVQQFVVGSFKLYVDWANGKLHINDGQIVDFSKILDSPYWIYKEIQRVLNK